MNCRGGAERVFAFFNLVTNACGGIAMKNEGVQFHIGDLNARAKTRLDEEENEVKRKKEKKRTAVDGAVASLEHAVQGKRMKV